MTAVDLGALDGDLFQQSEAVGMLSALANTLYVGAGYLTFMDPPDAKAAHNLERAAEFLVRAIRRAYPKAEAEHLIQKAERAAADGILAQKAAMGVLP